MSFDVARVRRDFPILDEKVHGKPLVYLDNAATTQKPVQVLDAMDEYYREYNSNVHRSIHALGERATDAYIRAHETVASFVGASSFEEIVFTKNCTEALNLVAYAWGLHHLGPGDEVLVTQMEHHSNFVPWQSIAKARGARLRIAPLTKTGEVDLEALKTLVSRKTRLVAFTAQSNVLGTLTPVREIADIARERGAVSVVDAAQSVPHQPTEVARLGCDFLAFSGHKMYGPTGIGVLYGRRDLLLSMEPFLFGGEMIRRVSVDGSTWNDLPWKFEAGTPNIAEAIGLEAAIVYLRALGMTEVDAHGKRLTRHALKTLAAVPGLEILGPGAEKRGPVAAFTLGEIHAHDLASLLDEHGVAIRAGHHCAQPLMESMGLVSAARASFGVYNEEREIDALAQALLRAREVFRLA